MKPYSLLLFVVSFTLLTACVPDKKAADIPLIFSTAGSTDSHQDERRGQSCSRTDCHDGTVIRFSISGTLYDNDRTTIYTNADIELYDDSYGSGTLITSLEVDAYGNFYTTEAMTNNTYYPAIRDNGTVPARMIYKPIPTAPTHVGNLHCGSCHGADAFSSTVETQIAKIAPLNIGIFSNRSKTSHNTGQNCFGAGCHNNGAPNFTAAGSVYQNDVPYEYLLNQSQHDIVSIEFFVNNSDWDPSRTDEPTRSERIGAIEVDASGNFYTTNPLTDISAVYYPHLIAFDSTTGFVVPLPVPNDVDRPELGSQVGHLGITSVSCMQCHVLNRPSPVSPNADEIDVP